MSGYFESDEWLNFVRAVREGPTPADPVSAKRAARKAKIQALIDRPGTPGEKAAAERAMAHLLSSETHGPQHTRQARSARLWNME